MAAILGFWPPSWKIGTEKVGSTDEIDRYAETKLHAKFGTFVRPVTFTLKIAAKPPDYIVQSNFVVVPPAVQQQK